MVFTLFDVDIPVAGTPLVGAEVGHVEFGDDAEGAGVLGVDLGDDVGQLEAGEAVGDGGAGGFGGVA